MNRAASFAALGLALAVAACSGSSGDDDGVVPPDARDIDAPLDAPLPMVGPEIDGKLVINEVLAINASSGTDATGAAGDWLEIYNPTAVDISLQNYAVTDDLMAPRKHIIGGGVVVAAHGYLVLWADNEPGRGNNHLRFSLDGDLGDLALTRPDSTFIDRVHYQQQETDFAAAREPDGSDAWVIEWHPSLGAANPAGSGQPIGVENVAQPPEAIPAAGDLSEQLLGYDAMPVFGLTISEADLGRLRTSPRAYVHAMVSVRGRDYGPVGVKLKGGNSFTDIDHKPSFRINVDEYVPGAQLFGLTDLTLNNMDDDLAMIRERLSYWVTRRVGLPASRCNHARLTVNGTIFGLYSNVETVKGRMMKRWFEMPDGPLFEATDVDFQAEYIPQYQLESGPDDRAMLTGLANALTITDPDQALAAAAAFIDLNHFRKFWAMSSVVGQLDSFPYSFPGDDIFLYADPSHKLTILPWGMDETFLAADFNVTTVSSVLATKCKASPTCFQAYVDATWDLLASVETMGWEAERQRVIDQIAPSVAWDTRKRYSADDVTTNQLATYWFMHERRLWLTMYLPPRSPSP